VGFLAARPKNSSTARRTETSIRALAGVLWNDRWWMLAVLIAAVLDGASTIAFMRTVGHDAEFHPAIRLVSAWFGPGLGPIIGKLGQLVALIGLCWWRPAWTRVLCVLTTGLSLAAAMLNVAQLR